MEPKEIIEAALNQYQTDAEFHFKVDKAVQVFRCLTFEHKEPFEEPEYSLILSSAAVVLYLNQ